MAAFSMVDFTNNLGNILIGEKKVQDQKQENFERAYKGIPTFPTEAGRCPQCNDKLKADICPNCRYRVRPTQYKDHI